MKLNGLQAENPIAWMAACGVLRLLPGARLRWDGTTPELDFSGDIIATLAALPLERRAAPELEYRHKLGARMDDTAWQDLKKLPGEWVLALGVQTESGMRATNLKIRASDSYDMVGDARKTLDKLLLTDIPQKLNEALAGPWRYDADDCVAWGWDAGARIDAAAVGSKAEDAPKRGVLGAYWLGWEALPLFPMIDGKTRGWSGGLWYPTWTEWLDYQDTRALMLGLDRLCPAERKALGVRTWFSRYLKFRNKVPSGRLSWASETARTRSDEIFPAGSRGAQATGFMIV